MFSILFHLLVMCRAAFSIVIAVIFRHYVAVCNAFFAGLRHWYVASSSCHVVLLTFVVSFTCSDFGVTNVPCVVPCCVESCLCCSFSMV